MEALSAYETTLFYEPSFFPAIHNIGSLNLIMGNTEQALYYFKAALERLKSKPGLTWHAEEKSMKVRCIGAY